jgi:hypothetical protein
VKYFVPDIRLIDVPIADEPPPPGWIGRLLGQRWSPVATVKSPTGASATERLGGVPWGLPSALWPCCRQCGRSLSLLAQFDHHPGRLDLGRAGRRLFVFYCAHAPGSCGVSEAFSGANACLVVEPEDLQDAETPIPSDNPPPGPAVYVAGWDERDDGIDEGLMPALMSDSAIAELDPEVLDKISCLTRLGGPPDWIQNADEAPAPGWRFIGQLDSSYSFLTSPSPCPAWVKVDRHRTEGRASAARGPDFGDTGMAYIFVRDHAAKPEACMFLQCC